MDRGKNPKLSPERKKENKKKLKRNYKTISLFHAFAHALPFRIASLTQIVFYDLYLGIYFPSSFYIYPGFASFFFVRLLRMRISYLQSIVCIMQFFLFSVFFFLSSIFSILRACNEMEVIFLCSHQSCLVDILIELS